MTQQSKKSVAHRLLGHAGIYAMGNILRQLAGFLMLPIYTRYLTPADYGVVGLMIFAISLMELVFGARLYWAIPKYYFDTKDKKLQASLVSTAMILTGAISAAAAIAMVFLRQPISKGLYGTPEFASIVGFFSVLLLTQSLEEYALVYLRLQQRPWFYITVSFFRLAIQLGLNVWFVVSLEMGAMGVAVSSMISSSIFALLLLAYTLRQVGWHFNGAIAEKMIRFCWPLWLGGFAGLYIGSANRYYLRIFTSLDDIGLFELAVKFSTIITVLIWGPFATYWQVERFNYYRQGNAESIFQNVFYFISTLMVVAAIGISIFAGPVIRIMAAPTFYRASEAVPFLAFGAVFGSLVIFSNFSFLAKEKTGWISRNNYLTAAVVTVLYLSLIPMAGHVGAAMALMLAQAVQFFVVHRASRSVYDMGISLRPLVGMLFISAVVCFLANVVLTSDSLLHDLAVKTLLYAVACGIILLPHWRNAETRRLLHELAPRFFPKHATDI
ncbi:undecaprenyl-diphospho-oligosaccharide flippase [Desulfuromonas soudanensis]|uniref:Undecaprenyl-diphospho-oligosaccharide flippase n=1 Tax=Desulfuromonas soudanensis TaxID=1603606 RepID=A0A0M4DIR2_9BACT|nr:polysaccharide biosynthesis C-terminal domain-containing protein [Desulfuromonas soudanensis]ALC16857.1 undecaprenyl-diphospho-oligosaccharide flippase [Desulfuromonas soudanensis]